MINERRTVRRPDLRCEAHHALVEYHGFEDGVGHRILCPVCDADYVRDLVSAATVVCGWCYGFGEIRAVDAPVVACTNCGGRGYVPLVADRAA